MAVQGGRRQLVLTWNDPNDGNIVNFNIYRGPSETQLAYYDQISANEFSYTDREVNIGENYSYAIAAVNAFGEDGQTVSVSTTAIWNEMDTDGDGVIDVTDFSAFSKEWLWEAPWAAP